MKLVQLNSEQIRIQEIIQGCLARNEVDEYLFYKEYFSIAMSVASRYANSKSQAKEMVNEGFYKIFKNLRKFDQKRKIEPWIGKVIANTCIDILRKNNKHFFLQFQGDQLDKLMQEQMDIDDEDLSSLDSVLPILQVLTPKYKLVFNLYVFEEYSHKEIAKKLKISVSTSKSNYFRAKKILKQAILDQRSQKLKGTNHG